MRTTRRLQAAIAAAAALTSIALLPGRATAAPLGGAELIVCPPDDGADLQAAIDASGPGDTIWLIGRCEGNFTVPAGKDVAIHGLFLAILDGGGSGTVLEVESGAHVALSDLRVTGGSSEVPDSAGGINVEGSAHLRRVHVVENRQGNTGFSGGGIRVGDSAELVMVGGAISHNVFDSGSTGAGGLALAAGSRAELTGVDVRWNRARGNSGAGIRTTIDSLLVMHRGSVAHNTHTDDDLTVPAAGGLYVAVARAELDGVLIAHNSAVGSSAGGLRLTSRGSAVLEGVEIRNNRVDAEETGSAGGVYVITDSDLTMRRCTVAHNVTEVSGTAGATHAGGIRLSDEATATLYATKVVGNRASCGGGGPITTGGISAIGSSTLDGAGVQVSRNRGVTVGGIRVSSGAEVDLPLSWITFNLADAGGTGGVLATAGPGPIDVGVVLFNFPNDCEPDCD